MNVPNFKVNYKNLDVFVKFNMRENSKLIHNKLKSVDA